MDGTGSFGKKCTQILLERYRPRRLVIFSRDELQQLEMQQVFTASCMRYFIGDVRDKARLTQALHGINFIIHATAMKHAPATDYNLQTIQDMTRRFGLITGLSDQTLGNAAAIASIALGASIIEKHFTLDRAGGEPDDSPSHEQNQLAALCRDIRTAWDALGKVDYSLKTSEIENTEFRRSLYFVKNFKQGDEITADTDRSARPGYGIAPKRPDDILGKHAARDIEANTSVLFDLIK